MCSDKVVLPYTPQDKQVKLHKSRARQILYGGAAGGGKSHALRWDAIELCLSNAGLDAYLFRRTLPQLDSNHIRKIRTEIPREFGEYNGTRKRFEFKNGSGINFCHCETEDDVLNYQGAEMHWLGIDEAGQFTSYQINYLRSRNRMGEFALRANPDYVSGNAPILPRCALSANPGGISHNYLKEIFIDSAPPETYFWDSTMKNPDNPKHKGWLTMFIPATMRDNKYLDEDYGGQFGGLSEWMQKMLRDGDWNVAAGAFFDCFDSRKNVIPPFEIPEHWQRFPSLDWGHATPFSIGWWAVASEDTEIGERTMPRGSLIRYREWYGALQGREKNKGLKMDGADVALQALSKGPEKLSVGVGDPSAWRSDGGPSQAEKMIRKGFMIRKADNERKAGWQEMYQRIRGIWDGKTYTPMLYVFDTCREFIRIIPSIPADEKDLEEVDSRFKEDHCFAAGTLVNTFYGPKSIETLVSGKVWAVNSVESFTCRQTRESETVWIEFEYGPKIRCTPDHRFLTTEGWIEAKDLLDKLCYAYMKEKAWSQSLAIRFRNLWESVITFVDGISNIKEYGSIGPSGSIQTAPSQKDSISTILMATGQTINSKTLNFLSGENINPTMGESEPTKSVNIFLRQEKKQRNGIEAQKGLHGIKSITKILSCIPSSIENVNLAIKNLRESNPSDSALILVNQHGEGRKGLMMKAVYALSAAMDSIQIATLRFRRVRDNAARLYRVKSVSAAPKTKVYCLTVPKTENFQIEDGIIVHNCADETRYACMSRPLEKEKPKQKRGTISQLTFADVAPDITTYSKNTFRERI